MKKSLSGYLLAAILLPLSGGAYASMFDYVGNWSVRDNGGVSGFSETLTLSNFFGLSGAGLVTGVSPIPDGLLGDPGEYIANSSGGAIVLTLDEGTAPGATSYAFNPTSYNGGFALFDDDGTQLFSATLTMNDLVLVGTSVGAINSMFSMNLTNIAAGIGYSMGSSAIVDAFLSNIGGAANFSLNIGGNIATAIHSMTGGSGSYSGSASVVPIPAALPLFISALGMLGFFGWRRRHA